MDMITNRHTSRAYERWWARYQRDTGTDAITAWTVQQWLQTLARQGLSMSSVRQARAALTKMAKARRLRGMMERDDYLSLVLEVETPRPAQPTARRKRRWLTLDELRAVTGALCAGRTEPARARNRVIALMLGTLGLREQEICAAQWGDLAEGRLAVRGKGGSYQVVNVPELLQEALATWRALVQTSGTYGEDTPIIRRVWKSGKVDGRGLGTSSVYRLVREAGERAGVGVVSPHDLRATVAGLLADAGVPVEDISRLLRHKNQEVTRRYIGRRGAKAGHVMAALLAEEAPTLPARQQKLL